MTKTRKYDYILIVAIAFLLLFFGLLATSDLGAIYISLTNYVQPLLIGTSDGPIGIQITVNYLEEANNLYIVFNDCFSILLLISFSILFVIYLSHKIKNEKWNIIYLILTIFSIFIQFLLIVSLFVPLITFSLSNMLTNRLLLINHQLSSDLLLIIIFNLINLVFKFNIILLLFISLILLLFPLIKVIISFNNSKVFKIFTIVALITSFVFIISKIINFSDIFLCSYDLLYLLIRVKKIDNNLLNFIYKILSCYGKVNMDIYRFNNDFSFIALSRLEINRLIPLLLEKILKYMLFIPSIAFCIMFLINVCFEKNYKPKKKIFVLVIILVAVIVLIFNLLGLLLDLIPLIRYITR